VVNNAANALTQPLGEFTPEAWQKSFDVNLRGPVFLVQAALPHLERSEHAAIVNVISAGAFLFSANVAMYGAAKAALMSFTRSMAAEFAPRGIRVNALAPGTVDTDMVRANPPAAQHAMANASPMRRAAHPDEMVGPVLFLASDASSFMTGQVLRSTGDSPRPGHWNSSRCPHPQIRSVEAGREVGTDAAVLEDAPARRARRNGDAGEVVGDRIGGADRLSRGIVVVVDRTLDPRLALPQAMVHSGSMPYPQPTLSGMFMIGSMSRSTTLPSRVVRSIDA
jgi:hypothetical protein